MYLISASNPESLGGSHLLKELETQVLAFANTCSGVVLVGRHVERPLRSPAIAGARGLKTSQHSRRG